MSRNARPGDFPQCSRLDAQPALGSFLPWRRARVARRGFSNGAAPRRERASERPGRKAMRREARAAYWRANLRSILVILAAWVALSFGAGILLADPLDAATVGGFPLGFWFANQ